MSTQYTQDITLDLNGKTIYQCVNGKLGDRASRFIRITLTANGETVHPEGVRVMLRCAKPDGTYVYDQAEINGDGTITAELTEQILAVEGSVFADLCLCDHQGAILSTASFIIQVAPVPHGKRINSSSEFLELMAVISQSNLLIGDYASAMERLEAVWNQLKAFPPAISLEEVENGHWVTVSDYNGEQTFFVANGRQGPAGENGTATDAQVSAWLDAHPEATTSVLDGAISPEKTTFIHYEKNVVTEKTPEFTNRIPLSVGTDGEVYNSRGWKANTRIDSSGAEVELEGVHITGFIPCVAGDVVRTGAGVIQGTNDNQSLCRYDASMNFLGRISYNAFAANGFSVSADGALYAPQSSSLTAMGYFRIVGVGIGDDAAVTVNEEVTYTVVEMEDGITNLQLDEAIAVPQAQENAVRLGAVEAALAAVKNGSQVCVEDYVYTEAARVAALAADVQNENTFSFLAAADLHYIPSEVNTPAIAHLGQAAKQIRNVVKLDAAAMLGDIISGADSDTPEVCKFCYTYVNQVTAEGFGGIPNVRLNGNHDCQPYNYSGYLTQSEIFARVGVWNTDAEIDGQNRAANYGYLDFDQQRIRLIYLNTCDIAGIRIKSQMTDFTGNRIGAQQLKWLIRTLHTVPAGWRIILLGHHPLDWVSNYYVDADGTKWEQNTVNAVYILDGYARGTSGSVWLDGSKIAYDFSETAAGEIIGYFHGHIHNFKVGTMGEAEILRIAIPNALPGRENSYNAVSGMFESEVYPKTAGTAEDTSFCVVTVDPVSRKIFAHHYGAGYDREISY